MKVMQLLLLLFCLGSAAVNAQDFIPLSDEDVDRLAIVFSPVSIVDRQAGSQFPATIVNSPDSVSVLTAPYAGVIEQWNAIPGTLVQAGTVLATIRSPQILQLQTQWLDARSELEQAQFAKQRDEELLRQGIVSQQRLQQTQREYRQAQIAVSAAVSSLGRAGFDESALQQLQNNGQRMGIYALRAPTTAVLSHRALVVGEYVAEYKEVASLQGSDQPWLSSKVPARLAAGLQPGHQLSLAGSGEAMTLRQKDLIIDETTQTVELLAEFNQSVPYLPGQVLSVVLAPLEDGVLIPADAVVHSGDDTVVFVEANQGVEARMLQLAPAGNNYIARSGIRSGERVVVQGTSVLKGIQLGLGSDE